MSESLLYSSMQYVNITFPQSKSVTNFYLFMRIRVQARLFTFEFLVRDYLRERNK